MSNSPTKHTIVLIIRKKDKSVEVCLGYKKQGFGAGKWNGFGGKLGDHILDETPEEGAIREVVEETKITVTRITPVGNILFHNPNGSAVIKQASIFLVTGWNGEPEETDEMRPKWFSVSEIPYDQMWPADRYWMPYVLDSKKIEAEFFYDKVNNFTKEPQITVIT